MNQQDLDSIVSGLTPVLKEYIAKKIAAGVAAGIAPIRDEFRKTLSEMPKPKDGENGKDADPVDVEALKADLQKFIGDAFEKLPKPVDGKSITVDELRPLIAEEAKSAIATVSEKAMASVDEAKASLAAKLEEAIAAIPVPKDGKSITVDDVRPILTEELKAAVASGIFQINEAHKNAQSDLSAKIDSAIAELPKPVDGKSVSAEDVMPELLAAAQEAIDKLPLPKDGKSVSVDEVLPILERAMESLHARWELDFERRAAEKFERAIDRMPKAVDGKDGLGFDDMAVDYDGERLVTLNFVRGETKKSFPLELPVVIYRGIFDETSAYKNLDSVTYDGSVWISQKDAPAGKPGLSTDWRLSVKRGRNGKPGENGKDFTPRGPVKLT